MAGPPTDEDAEMTAPNPAGRDRDERGRPRNARDRDALGRPLPRGVAGLPPLPDDLRLPPAETLAEAHRLLATGRPFQAHEVLEAAWKCAPAEHRPLWQGLAQLAVGITHAARGNRRGAARLLRRGGDRLAGCAADLPCGLDAAALAGWVAEALNRVEAVAGPVELAPPPLPH